MNGDNAIAEADAPRASTGSCAQCDGAAPLFGFDLPDSVALSEEELNFTRGDVLGPADVLEAALDEDPDHTGPVADVPADLARQQLMRQFEAWLDRMSEGEPPPEGLPEELLADASEAPGPRDGQASDLYTLFAALTKLSGEIGLQGRAFKQLTDVLGPLAQVPGKLDRVEAVQGAVARELANRIEAVEGAVAREIARLAEPEKTDSELPAAQDLLAVLFDLYDRLNRGLRTFDAGFDAMRLTAAPSQTGPAGFLQRLLARAPAERPMAPAEAMREGYRLTLARLEGAMRQWGIKRIGEIGETFDPERMAAIEVEVAAGVPDGSILEVYRSGYMLHGRMLETARVKVSKVK